MGRATVQELDEILSIQLLLAWAGETPGGDQPRLGWWKTGPDPIRWTVFMSRFTSS